MSEFEAAMFRRKLAIGDPAKSQDFGGNPVREPEEPQGSEGTQGTDRGRKAPAGTLPRRAPVPSPVGWPPRKVGAGGDASPHFHMRAMATAGQNDARRRSTKISVKSAQSR
jgi:hypothetical protein